MINYLLPEDVALLEDLGARISQSLDSARLFTETQHRAEYERLASLAAARMRESLDVKSVLKSAAEDIYQLLNLDQLTIDLSVSAPLEKENGRSDRENRAMTQSPEVFHAESSNTPGQTGHLLVYFAYSLSQR